MTDTDWINIINKVKKTENNRKDKSVTEYMEKDPDFCYTTDKMAKYLIDSIDFEDGDMVMEPCFGKGAFYNNLPNNVIKEFCEIDLDKNYLEYNGEVDITLSNPPFVPRTLFWDFHVKAMMTTRKNIYWLINRCWVDVFTPKRLNEMNEKGWYIESFKVVADKRWYGRYYWIKFGKTPNNMFSWCSTSF